MYNDDPLRQRRRKYNRGHTAAERDQRRVRKQPPAADQVAPMTEMAMAMAGAMASTPEGEEEYSHLTRLQRYSYAAGAVGVWGPLVAFSALRSTIYVIYLEAVRVHAALCVCVRVYVCCFQMFVHVPARAYAHECAPCRCTCVHPACDARP